MISALSRRLGLMRRHWPDLALILILALLPCLFFWRLLTPNPADRLFIVAGDFTEQYFPLRAFVAQAWVQSQIPLWNPYLFGGQPALADIQSGALYPPHVIEALILGWGGPLFGREIGFPVWALEFQVVLHFSLAAVGTYLFARHLGRLRGMSLRRARFGGLIASLVFTYGGYLTGFPVQQMTILEVSAWLPWVIWAISVANQRVSESASQRISESAKKNASDTRHASRFTFHVSRFTFHVSGPSPALQPAAWGALAFAMAILAGHPQTVLYIFYLSLAYTVFRAFQAWRSMTSTVTSPCPAAQVPTRSVSLLSFFRFSASYLLVWLVVILLGASMAAVQLLPTLEFIAHSLRADLSYQAVSTGLPLNEFISILYPGFFGGSPEYVGIGTLVLIGLALTLVRPRGDVVFWAGAGLISFVLAFGGNTFLYPIFYLLVPGFGAVRQQERAFLVYSFSAAILAGYGAMLLAGPLSKSSRRTYTRFEHIFRIVVGVALGLTGFFIYGATAATARGDEVNLFLGVLRHHLFGLLMLGGMVFLLTLRSRRWLHRPWGMGLMALWLGFNLFTVNWRFNLEKRENSEPFTPNGVVQFLQHALGIQEQNQNQPGRIVSGGLLPGGNSAASIYNLQDLTGNTPLQLAAVATFFQQMPAWRMWQLMNVRYVVADQDITGNGLSLVFAEDELKVFEIGDPFPRAWFVSDTEIIPEDGPAIARLAADDFDLRRKAILTDSLDISLEAALSSTVTVVDFNPTRLTAVAEAAGTHLLVFSQIYYPGWQAQLDGQTVELWRVNVVQQGLVVPAGQHTVELTFRSRSFRLGGIVSILAILLWVGFYSSNAVRAARKNTFPTGERFTDF